jgi:hypothetical protein
MDLIHPNETKLVWYQTDRASASFELRRGKSALAKLMAEGKLSSRFLGEYGENRCSFTLLGILRPSVVVTDMTSHQVLAKVQSPFLGWQGGRHIIALAGGEVFYFQPASPFNTTFVLISQGGHPLLSYNRPALRQPWAETGKLSCTVQLSSMERHQPNLPLLLLLTRYLFK